MKQPNPHFRSLQDLNARDSEHFRVAQSFPANFTSAEFRRRYGTMFPARNDTSIIPSDYCFNRENKGNHLYPRFLVWQGGSVYVFAGLDGSPARD